MNIRVKLGTILDGVWQLGTRASSTEAAHRILEVMMGLVGEASGALAVLLSF